MIFQVMASRAIIGQHSSSEDLKKELLNHIISAHCESTAQAKNSLNFSNSNFRIDNFELAIKKRMDIIRKRLSRLDI